MSMNRPQSAVNFEENRLFARSVMELAFSLALAHGKTPIAHFLVPVEVIERELSLSLLSKEMDQQSGVYGDILIRPLQVNKQKEVRRSCIISWMKEEHWAGQDHHTCSIWPAGSRFLCAPDQQQQAITPMCKLRQTVGSHRGIKQTSLGSKNTKL